MRIQRGLAGSKSDRFDRAGNSDNGGNGDDGVVSHTGNFVIANFDRSGQINPLLTGLDTAQDDGVAGVDTALVKYGLARARQRFLKENRQAGFFAR